MSLPPSHIKQQPPDNAPVFFLGFLSSSLIFGLHCWESGSNLDYFGFVGVKCPSFTQHKQFQPPIISHSSLILPEIYSSSLASLTSLLKRYARCTLYSVTDLLHLRWTFGR